MDKKAKTNTPDIRSFFSRPPAAATTNSNGNTNGNSNVVKKKVVHLSSGEDDSPIKKNNFTELKRTEMPKRKKAYLIESSESEEEVIRTKKSKKSTDDKSSDKKVKTPPKKETSKRKVVSSDDDYEPYEAVKEKKAPAKKDTDNKRKVFSSDDDYEPFEPVKAKKAAPAKKSTTSANAKKASKATNGKETSKPVAKSNSKSNAKSEKLVKPLDYDSADDGKKGLDSVMVKKGQNVVTGFSSNQNQTQNGKKVVDEMWVDKYKPQTVAKIIGQHTPKSCANKLKYWLDHWIQNKEIKPKFGSKNDTGAGLRAALLSGPPGIGKTTTAQLVAKECGYEFVEFNASDTRNKKSMDEQVQTLLSNKTLDGFFSDPTNKTKMTSKHLLIMDEVDGMGGADRGGIAELIQFIKKTSIPIICICNDRNSAKIRNLANYCFDLRFSKPRTEQIKSMVLSICSKEGVKVDSNLISEIIEMSNHDIRQVIHYFSIFAAKNKKLDDVKNHKIIKDVTLGPFDAVKRMFTSSPEYDSMTINEKANLFFNDYQLMPLFAWENYIQCKPSSSKTAIDSLQLAAKSMNAMCIGDQMETQIRTSQNWSFLPLQAVFSTVMPGYYMNGHFSDMIQFPSLLGKISSLGKKDRMLQELKLHMNLKVSGSKTCLNLDYMLPLRDKILNPLVNQEDDGVNKAIETLDNYCLLKDDLDSIIELSMYTGDKNPFLKVDTKTKSALTRTYNKNNHSLPYANKDMITKVGKGASKSKKKSDFKSDDEDGENEDEIVDEDQLPDF